MPFRTGVYLTDFTKEAKSFVKNLNSSVQSAVTLAERMKGARRLREKSSPTVTGPRGVLHGGDVGLIQLEPVLTKFAEVLFEIAGAQEILAESLDSSFVKPIENFSRKEVAKVADLRKDFNSASDAHDAAVQRYLHPTSRGSVGSNLRSMGMGRARTSSGNTLSAEEQNAETAKRRAVDVASTLRDAEIARFSLTYKLNELEARKTFELSESIVASMYSFRTYFHQCLDTINTLTPFMEQLQDTQQQMRADFQSGKKPWEIRRQQLNEVLNALPTPGTTSPPGSSSPSPITVPGSSEGGSGENLGDGAATEAEAGRAQARTGTGTGTVNSTSSEAGSGTAAADRDTASATAAVGGLVEDPGAWLVSTMQRLTPLYEPRRRPGIIREGYLYRRGVSRMLQSTWSRCWFLLDEDSLYCIKNPQDLDPEPVCDVMLATVRDVAGEAAEKLPNGFEIISANRKSEMLQAMSASDHDLWTSAIRSCIEVQLSRNRSSPPTPVVVSYDRERSGDEDGFRDPDPSRGGNGQYSSSPPRTGGKVSSPRAQEALRNALWQAGTNSACADCGAANPEWVSINLGVMLCIECSGIHRSLGSHISKVRSLVLDDLPVETTRLLSTIGNSVSNRIWEHTVQEGWSKPTASDDRATKEQWIRSKYQWRGFVNFSEGSSAEEQAQAAERDLRQAAAAGDVPAALEAIAHGASVNFVDLDEGKDGRTALHLAAAGGHEQMCEFLWLNGADLHALDAKGETPVNGASEHPMVVALLTGKAEQHYG